MGLNPDESIANSTWADGYGRWHASVPLSGSWRKDAAAARKLIMDELFARSAPNVRPVFSITLERITNHGTAIYGEKA